MLKRIVILICWMLAGATIDVAADSWDKNNYRPKNQKVNLQTTNLPIVFIDTHCGAEAATVIHKDYRVAVRMKIIHNQTALNHGDTTAFPDQRVDYEGWIGIKYRGFSSFNDSAKKPYGFKTLATNDVAGKKKKVALLDMPKDNDWVLLAPYHDRSCMRDVLVYELARPYFEFTPQTRFVELVLDGIYYGLYILCERAGKGKYRLNLTEPTDEADGLTGDYHVQVDRNDEPHFLSKYKSYNKDSHIQFKFPEYEDMNPLHPLQEAYIKRRYHEMEDAFMRDNYTDPESGYRKHIDVASFINYQLINELTMNQDAYRLSANMYKRRDSVDPRFKMTVWDFNLSLGNNYSASTIYGNWFFKSYEMLSWVLGEPIPFYWKRLMEDPAYMQEMKEQWACYRRGNVSNEHINQVIDSLNNELTAYDAIERNFAAWPNRWDVVPLAPNISTSHDGEIKFLRKTILDRAEWMDGMLDYDPMTDGIESLTPDTSPVGEGGTEGEGFRMKDSGVFNMAGQRMSGLHKGLNIVNGRKVICR